MRADRLLAILLTLQRVGRATTRQLAERLEVSERTIHRDMDALTGAGVPVYAERGPKGGWRLLGEYRTDLTGLSPAEAQALLVGPPARLLEDLGLAKASEGAWLKLLASLPRSYRSEVESVRGRVYVEPRGGTEGAPLLPILLDALWQNREVEMTYERQDGERSVRRVAPLGLVARGATWYLVAQSEAGPRTFRVSRVLEAALTDTRFAPPEGFDLRAHWRAAQAEFKERLPRYSVRARVEAAALERLGLVGRWATLEASTPLADGWLEARVRFETAEDALAWALSLGSRAEVLEPPQLRARVAASARELLAAYSLDGRV
jgi:predicted DNA-binding transcriptional regulator YafY